ncbi:hypothetical protein BK816_04635 [Boudabousia tangfeifanii]|uniref:BioF2-like acetyltransferase domain-containing protein n=1 Tax=Boudabousia tangfeifanii TaxID=1912795 RepID=A0A1D9MK35_9ACTO|nr:peptidoglycan bridge formation glycyltransferase FemA/FemB family protein [Boudabousia tangfeifanii]AOZ72665.1 hypothetical protein BK816_04635 [Boudabousia tangfeifanii]
MKYALRRVDDIEYENLIAAAKIQPQIEQSPLWDKFDLAVGGRQPYGRFVFESLGEDRRQVLAVISLTKFKGRGFTYLWAKKGPLWAHKPSPGLEYAFLKTLQAYIAKRDKNITFVRLHLEHPRDDVFELLQTLTYDRTVKVDLRPSEDEILAQMKKRGRRCIRAGEKQPDLEVVERTGLSREEFDEIFKVLEETAQRDGFRLLDDEVYWQMLQSLGPEHARLFVTECDGEPLSWNLMLVYANQAEAYYGASSAHGRSRNATELLEWRIMQKLKAEGVESYDFMGVESDRAPQLSGVTTYKTKFAREITEVPGAWDFPIFPTRYAMLVSAMNTKRTLVEVKATALERLRSLSLKKRKNEVEEA